jgi:hypothetical protein
MNINIFLPSIVYTYKPYIRLSFMYSYGDRRLRRL